MLRDSLLGPLGMDRSTFDRDEIVAATDRAIGHAGPVPELPAFDAMTAAGGLYSSAADLARYLRFQLDDGSLDGVSVLDPALMTEMRTIPAPDAGAPAGYALGVVRYRWRVSRNAELFSHGGGGFGFLSDLWWSPPLGVGVAVLTNSATTSCRATSPFRSSATSSTSPAASTRSGCSPCRSSRRPIDPDGGYVAPAGMADLVRDAGMTPRGDEAERWGRYAGTYRTWNFGVFDPTAPPARFFVSAGVPYFDADEEGGLVHHRLTEVEPGLFLTGNGQTLDLRGSPPTWRNLDLVRVNGGPVAWQWVLLAAAVAAAVAWLAGGLVAAVRVAPPRSDRRRTSRRPEPGWGRLAAVVGAVTAVLVLATVALVAALPAGVEAGFLGWLEWPWPMRLALHFPLALLLAAGSLAILNVVGWARRWWPAATGRRHLLLVAPSLVFVAQLAAWGVIGWGLT